MRFLLVMLAVAAPMTLPACENTKAGERNASASSNTKDLAPVALQPGGLQPGAVQAEQPRAHELRSDALRPEASGVTSAPGAEARRVPSEGAGTPTHDAKHTAGSGITNDAIAIDGIAKNAPAGSGTATNVAGNPPPTAADEGGVDEGNGEPMDDVDDEEASATDKSGVDSPAVDEEPEGTGIKLQE